MWSVWENGQSSDQKVLSSSHWRLKFYSKDWGDGEVLASCTMSGKNGEGSVVIKVPKVACGEDGE